MAHQNEILIIAGEASGDMHGAALMTALHRIDPGIRFFGVGGQSMRRAGLEALYKNEDFAVMGLREVIAHYRFFKRALARLQNEMKTRLPRLVILIDFPDFNFRVAGMAKRSGIPVFYYIAPQVWAWRKGRAKTMARIVDHLAAIFEFELDFFKGKGLPVTFVGHPLLDQPGPRLSAEAFRKELGLLETDTLVGLVPGSRKQEIERMLPVMTQAAKILSQRIPNLRFVVSCAPSLEPEFLRAHMNADFPVWENRTKEIMSYSKIALVTSGTATLETALCLTPMVVLYKTSALTFALLRMLIRVPNISLVNLVARKRIVPELIQKQANPNTVVAMVERFLKDPDYYFRTKSDLASLRSRLGSAGAADRAAKIAYSLLDQ